MAPVDQLEESFKKEVGIWWSGRGDPIPIESSFEMGLAVALIVQGIRSPFHLLPAGNGFVDLVFNWLRWGVRIIAAWLAGLVVLLLAGMLLSRLIVVAVARTPARSSFAVTEGERTLHWTYRVVVVIASLYYYVSVAILVMAVIGMTAFGTFLALGMSHPAFFLLIIAGLYFVTDILRSVFALLKYEEPERALSREEAPKLWAVIDQVAERLDTRSVDTVYIVPDATIAVTERGSLLQKLRGAGERCLFIGLGTLNALTQGQFVSILAHEYGHFAVRDTLANMLSWHVQLRLHRMGETLIALRQSHWSHPMWGFVWVFSRVFARITLGASRLREILADRYAAMAYGGGAFVEGLTRLVRAGLAHGLRLPQQVELSVRTGLPLANLYRSVGFPAALQGKLEDLVEERMNRGTSPYDSHPAPKERIRMVRQLPATDPEPVNQEPVWDLFQNPEELQEEMMDIIRADVRKWAELHGLRWGRIYRQG
jgi:Zn-dependent protease with chaperone function